METINEGVTLLSEVAAGGTRKLTVGTFCQKDAGLSADPSQMIVSGTISTESRDHSGDIMVAAGGQLDVHAKNPVVLLNHGFSYDLPIGKAEDPLGNYTVRQLPDRITATTWFSQKSLVALQTFDLINDKILKGISIGFKPLEWEQLSPAEGNYYNGMKVLRWSLLEYSHVTIPDNPEALTDVVGKNLLCGSPIEPALYKSLSSFLPAKTSVTVPVNLHALGQACKSKVVTDPALVPFTTAPAASAVVPAVAPEKPKGKARNDLRKKRAEELAASAAAVTKLLLEPLNPKDAEGDDDPEPETESAPAQSGVAKDEPAKNPADPPDPEPKKEPTVPDKNTAANGRKATVDGETNDETVVKDDGPMNPDDATVVDDRPPGAQALDQLHAQMLAVGQTIEDLSRSNEKPQVLEALDAASQTVADTMAMIEGVYATNYPDEDPISPDEDETVENDVTLTSEDVPTDPEGQKRKKRMLRKSRLAARRKHRVGVKKLSKGIASVIKEAAGYLDEMGDHSGEMKASQKSAARYHAKCLKALSEDEAKDGDTLQTPTEAEAKRLRAEVTALKAKVKDLSESKAGVEKKCMELALAMKKLTGN